MKTLKIVYWVATVLAGLAFLMGGFQDLSHNPEMVEGMKHLGYPEYFMNILGTAKLLGAVALLVPKFPRLKEWAYAGCVFDVIGAFWSHAASGDMGHLGAPVIVLLIIAASYVTFRLIQNKETNSFK